MVSLTEMMDFLAKPKVAAAGVGGVVTTGSLVVTSCVGVVTKGSSVVTSIGGVLTSSGGVLTSRGDGGIVTASGGMAGKGRLVVTSAGAGKVASGIKVEVTSTTRGGMVTSTGGLVTLSRGGCRMATGSGTATGGGVVKSLGAAVALDFPTDVELKDAFTYYYRLNRLKIGAESGLKGENLKTELIRIWMNLEKSEKMKYYTNCIPEIKEEKQLKKRSASEKQTKTSSQ